MFFSLDRTVTKNQKPNTKYQKCFVVCFNLKKEENNLSSSLLKLNDKKEKEKRNIGWNFVFSYRPIQWKEQNLPIFCHYMDDPTILDVYSTTLNLF